MTVLSSRRLDSLGTDRARTSALAFVVVSLNLLGWGTFALYAGRYPAIAGLGTVAYTLGLRHGFDVDHIAAIDNVTRKLIQEGKRPLGVGFFFSLGHSLVVFCLAIPIALTARAFHSGVYGAIGLAVAGGFLYLIALMNLASLRGSIRLYRQICGACPSDGDGPQAQHAAGGLMSRLVPQRVFQSVGASWQMLGLGAIFAFGFETAAQVGLLAATAGAATERVPVCVIVSLPLLFAAGMVLVDTADGVLMRQAYAWALVTPLRRAYYNVVLTSLSVLVALVVGTIEVLQLLAATLHQSFAWLDSVDFESLGYAVVGTFALVWVTALVLWRLRGEDESVS